MGASQGTRGAESAAACGRLVVDRSCTAAGGAPALEHWLMPLVADALASGRASGQAADLRAAALSSIDASPSAPHTGDMLLDAVTILVVGPTVAAPELHALRVRSPALLIAVCTDDATGRSWLRYARAGADAVFVMGSVPHAAGLAAWVRTRLALPMPGTELLCLASALPHGPTGQVVGYCLRNATERRSVTSIAAWFGSSERTLRRRLMAAGLPHVAQLWNLGRVLHVQESVRRGGHVGEAVHAVGFAEAKAYYAARVALREACAADGALRHLVAPVRSLAWLLVVDADEVFPSRAWGGPAREVR